MSAPEEGALSGIFQDNAHLRARTDSIAAMLRVWDKLAHGFGD